MTIVTNKNVEVNDEVLSKNKDSINKGAQKSEDNTMSDDSVIKTPPKVYLGISDTLNITTQQKTSLGMQFTNEMQSIMSSEISRCNSDATSKTS